MAQPTWAETQRVPLIIFRNVDCFNGVLVSKFKEILYSTINGPSLQHKPQSQGDKYFSASILQ